MNINKITELKILSIDVQEFIKAILKDVVNGEIRLYCNKMKCPFIELALSKVLCKRGIRDSEMSSVFYYF